MVEFLKKYVHKNWEGLSEYQNDKYYFVEIPGDLETYFAEIAYQLEIEIPQQLRLFYQNFGYGFLWSSLKQKKGLYRILSPEEILDLYFEPEIEKTPDDFITYRENAWENLETNKLLAFCLMGEEDSLLYVGTTDGSIYYLSPTRKIANSFEDFLKLLDNKVDYFMK